MYQIKIQSISCIISIEPQQQILYYTHRFSSMILDPDQLKQVENKFSSGYKASVKAKGQKCYNKLMYQWKIYFDTKQRKERRQAERQRRAQLKNNNANNYTDNLNGNPSEEISEDSSEPSMQMPYPDSSDSDSIESLMGNRGQNQSNTSQPYQYEPAIEREGQQLEQGYLGSHEFRPVRAKNRDLNSIGQKVKSIAQVADYLDNCMRQVHAIHYLTGRKQGFGQIIRSWYYGNYRALEKQEKQLKKKQKEQGDMQRPSEQPSTYYNNPYFPGFYDPIKFKSKFCPIAYRRIVNAPTPPTPVRSSPGDDQSPPPMELDDYNFINDIINMRIATHENKIKNDENKANDLNNQNNQKDTNNRNNRNNTDNNNINNINGRNNINGNKNINNISSPNMGGDIEQGDNMRVNNCSVKNESINSSSNADNSNKEVKMDMNRSIIFMNTNADTNSNNNRINNTKVDTGQVHRDRSSANSTNTNTNTNTNNNTNTNTNTDSNNNNNTNNTNNIIVINNNNDVTLVDIDGDMNVDSNNNRNASFSNISSPNTNALIDNNNNNNNNNNSMNFFNKNTNTNTNTNTNAITNTYTNIYTNANNNNTNANNTNAITNTNNINTITNTNNSNSNSNANNSNIKISTNFMNNSINNITNNTNDNYNNNNYNYNNNINNNNMNFMKPNTHINHININNIPNTNYSTNTHHNYNYNYNHNNYTQTHNNMPNYFSNNNTLYYYYYNINNMYDINNINNIHNIHNMNQPSISNSPPIQLFPMANVNPVNAMPSSHDQYTMLNNAAYSLASGLFPPNQPSPHPENNIMGNIPQVAYDFANSLISNSPTDINNRATLFNQFIKSDFFANFAKMKMAEYQQKKQRQDAFNAKNQSIRQRYLPSGDRYSQQSKLYGIDYYKRPNRTLEDRAVPYIFAQQQSYLSESTRRRMDYIKNTEDLKNHFEVKSVKSSKKVIKQDNQILKTTPLSQFQQVYDKMQKRILKEIQAKPDELPINDTGLHMTPNMDKLSEMTWRELQKVHNVTFQNKFGKIKFKQPIILYKKRISDSIKIEQDLIVVFDKDWKGKRCEVCLKNFNSYQQANEFQKSKLKRKVQKWADKNKMNIISFDQRTGDTVVEFLV